MFASAFFFWNLSSVSLQIQVYITPKIDIRLRYSFILGFNFHISSSENIVLVLFRNHPSAFERFKWLNMTYVSRTSSETKYNYFPPFDAFLTWALSVRIIKAIWLFGLHIVIYIFYKIMFQVKSKIKNC